MCESGTKRGPVREGKGREGKKEGESKVKLTVQSHL